MSAGSVLLIANTEPDRQQLQEELKHLGCHVLAVDSAAEALNIKPDAHLDVVITDLTSSESNWIETLSRIREMFPGTPVVVVTAFGGVENAVAAMKAGAADYLAKPIERSRLEAVVARFTGHRRHREFPQRLLNRQAARTFANIIGSSKALLHVLDDVSRVAGTDATVLIRGETGTGKELMARAIHDLSPRYGQSFVVVNCGAIPSELLESELFGYTKGSFTGATAHKTGKVETAHKGTLFLDEIGELPLALQTRILRLIQEREIEKVGGGMPIKVDVRILAATHRDLETMVAAGSFRQDLYYRLLVVPIEIPPLRDRPEEIPELVEYMFAKYTLQYGHTDLILPPELIPLFSNYRWPGNVRELENAIQRVVLLSKGTQVTREDLPAYLTGEPAAPQVLSAELPERGLSLEALERELIARALAKFGGNQTRAARFLDMSRRSLGYRMHKFGLPPKVVRIRSG
jgi:two-component system NtrC family response regulator